MVDPGVHRSGSLAVVGALIPVVATAINAAGNHEPTIPRPSSPASPSASAQCTPYPTVVEAPPKPGEGSFEIGVEVKCAPRTDRIYLLAVQLEKQGVHQTLNTYPKRIFTSSFRERLNVGPTPRHFLVFNIPVELRADVTALINQDRYYYEPGFPPPSSFELAAERVSVTPQVRSS
jgi:hypothetical protein